MVDRRGVPDLREYCDSAESYYRLHLEATREHDFHNRVTASWGLIARGADSLPYLILMLRSSNPDSREDAAGALAWLGQDSDGVVSELLTALRGEHEDQPRDGIVLALGALKNRAAVPALAALIRSDNTDGDTRDCAVESLGKIVRRRFHKQDDPVAAATAWLDKHGD
ncbi:HEAT repeat domain-containing protein [Micromonospora sp. CPCC 206171]|uniref:HEAT repeat domain-containing protein n=1 Tax=Micromonospora sp. CPCC 206171 TaxID=3122405 RepID=UPI002FF3A5BE